MKTYTKTCPECGKEFTTTKAIQKYCSLSCNSKYNKRLIKARKPSGQKKAASKKPQTVNCLVCGEEFISKNTALYCSAECREAARIQRYRAAHGAKTCPICGMSFYATKQRQKYCSAECAGQVDYRKGPRPTREPASIADICRPNRVEGKLAAEGHKIGLSYGQYVAMREMGARYELRKETE